MSNCIVQVELRVFNSVTNRDTYGFGKVDGDELMANPKDYGVTKIVVVDSVTSLISAVSGQQADKCAFTKLLTTATQKEHEAGYTTSLDTALGWFSNP